MPDYVKQQTPAEGTLAIGIIDRGGDGFGIEATDHTGRRILIATLNKSGQFYLHQVTEDSGLDVDNKGHIIIAN